MPPYQNHIQDERIKSTEEHIATINEELGSVKVDVAMIKIDVCWIKKNYWLITTASVGALVGAIINLIIR